MQRESRVFLGQPANCQDSRWPKILPTTFAQAYVSGRICHANHQPSLACRGRMHRRTFLADVGMGFTGPGAWGRCSHRDGVVRADETQAWQPPDGQPHFRAEGQERHLAVHERRRVAPGDLRSQAGADQVRRQDDRRDAVRGRAEPREAQARPRRGGQRRQRPAAQQALSAAGRLPEARPERHRGQRLVAAPGRRASTTSPSSARCGPPTTITAPRRSSTPAGTCSTASSRRSAPGSTTAWARSTTTCRSSSRWASASTGTPRTATTSARRTTPCRSASIRPTRSTTASPAGDVERRGAADRASIWSAG